MIENVRTVYNKFARGLWVILEEGENYYIYYAKPTGLPQLMLIVKGKDTFTALAEATELMYSLLHPEVMWSDSVKADIDALLAD
jgi:hypothetical protein